MTERVPAEVFPPGEFVRDELEARGWTQADLAEILGRPPRLISEIVGGKRAVTPETAKGLAAAFGTEPQLWMNLESAYQLSKVKPNDDAVSRRANLYSKVPLKEMVKRHWIEPTENIDVLEQRVRKFLEIETLDAPMPFAAAARSSTEVTAAQCVWLARARQLARMVHASKFSKQKIDPLCAALKPLLASPQEARQVPRVLAEFGIRFVVVEALPNSRIDGACFWLSGNEPVIAVSLRFDRIDAFWFTLLHELAHVKNEDGKSTEDGTIDLDLIDGKEATDTKPEAEKKANAFAAETMIPEKDIRDFIARVRPLYSKPKIVGFASRIGVHPGVVIGRLQFLREIPYSHSREMLVKIRSFVSPSAMTDGWGDPIQLGGPQ